MFHPIIRQLLINVLVPLILSGIHGGDRKRHDMRYAIDPTKIHNELRWFPKTKFEDGIKKIIKWYLDNREWWEKLFVVG